MAMEQSAGGVVYTYAQGKRLYVVVTELHGHVGLPKGHMEAGETPRETALREIYEETGLRVTLHPDVFMEETYRLPRGGEKHVTYFLARYDGQELKTRGQDVRAAALLPLETALRALTFPGAKRILQEADRALERIEKGR